MNAQLHQWSLSIIFATFCVLSGMIGIFSNKRHRWFANGLLIQGVLLLFVVGGPLLQGNSQLQLAALALSGLLIVREWFAAPDSIEEVSIEKADLK